MLDSCRLSRVVEPGSSAVLVSTRHAKAWVEAPSALAAPAPLLVNPKPTRGTRASAAAAVVPPPLLINPKPTKGGRAPPAAPAAPPPNADIPPPTLVNPKDGTSHSAVAAASHAAAAINSKHVKKGGKAQTNTRDLAPTALAAIGCSDVATVDPKPCRRSTIAAHPKAKIWA
ncbi:hypothetical protein CEUSTIGMA_g5432.t1 [Chlamydomonas eustigma]|uniref:Uncharacterized protein n=1 Tax=Chlamydomonas eustigma TaxID=1157962 RepID=A0A250X5F7_9CHLO|nr:hypothetical protein CEUSTIGMA_g5432.t1 [Chlamydomonas eustigma]|eukprot:GAX77990.1 hypothetical protein CEUSTIGMA_g5432.t1 [Chlamydomonas eustigma]